ncbi:MAG: hypothetical protein DLM56_03820 [Pseudonocardiales bacterium]|nr:MAG: hypothetical protein DLM56_03820 [Pseudonocardiales bacterium]
MIAVRVGVRRLRACAAARLLVDDAGTAIIEFVFLGILMLIPLVYLILAISYVQRNTYGVTEAAREVGRVYATSGSSSAATYAAGLAMEDQGQGGADISIGWGPPGTCGAGGFPPLTPGGVYSVCVTRQITIPGVPHFIGASHNSVSGRFVLHVDDYRIPGS